MRDLRREKLFKDLSRLIRLRMVATDDDDDLDLRFRILPAGERALRACAAAEASARASDTRAHPSSKPSKGIGPRSRAAQP